jgi:fatty-acid peroxygenase
MSGPDLPGDARLDRSLAFLREGYEFIPRRCARYGSDVFQTRLMGRRVVCLSGAEAAREFYAPGRTTRQGALPPTVLTLLQDKGSVAVTDGEAHRHRKAMFLEVMRPGRFDALCELADAEWRDAAERWSRRPGVALHPVAQEVLCRAVCAWAGVPLGDEEAPRRTRELAAMIDGAGAFGPRQWRGQLLRARTERWLRRIVARIRSGDLHVPADSAAAVIAQHRDLDGRPLDVAVAAVELLNVLRPTVAVARFVTFAALALHEHPDEAEAVRAGRAEQAEWFAQEVRRLAPFFPLVGGRLREPFTWRGHRFERDAWLMLDIYGTNRDPRAWDDPERFRPARFRDWAGDPFTLIPQGGGSHEDNHRCAGEWITIALLTGAVRFLAADIDYAVPAQDLAVDLARMPALPRSGFVMTGVRRVTAAA